LIFLEQQQWQQQWQEDTAIISISSVDIKRAYDLVERHRLVLQQHGSFLTKAEAF
jgi:glycine cleavage system H lipoate-binding protein